jgi:peroxiredoxin
MNERIKLLAEQAGMTVDKFGMFFAKDKHNEDGVDLEKFAELIVQECMTTIFKESKWYWDKDEFESSNAVQNAARRVKEHFGVEE